MQPLPRAFVAASAVQLGNSDHLLKQKPAGCPLNLSEDQRSARQSEIVAKKVIEIGQHGGEPDEIAQRAFKALSGKTASSSSSENS